MAGTSAAQSYLPACNGSLVQSWTNCFGVLSKNTGQFQDSLLDNYAGEFQDGLFHGQGAYTFIGGDKFIGGFNKHKFNGQGILYRFDGSVIQSGNWTDGKFTYSLAPDINKFPFKRTSQIAIQPSEITIDPILTKLQNEVLQRERELANSAVRQAEEKRLRDRLAELNRLTQAEFKDDLPLLLAKITAAKPNPRIHVLAIGINDYADVPDVPFADRSAEQFAKIVEKLLGVQKQNTIVLTNADATSGRLRGRLRTLLNRLGPQDQLVLYYAGHGVPGKDGKSAYLLAQDGGPGSYEEPALRLEQLYADIAKSRVGAAMLFIDACFSGRSGKDSIVFEGIAPILVTPKQSFPDSQRLAVMTAGRGDQFSNQNKDSGHRLFSYHLMRAMLETSPSLEIGSLHNRLRQRVLDDSRRIGPEFEQEPELQGNSKLPLLN
jgi:hypothetical protein